MFEGVFIKQNIDGNKISYSGYIFDESVTITNEKMDNQNKVLINIGDKYSNEYLVKFGTINDNGLLDVSIYEKDKAIFNGYYADWGLVRTGTGGVSFDENSVYYIADNIPDWQNYSVPLGTIANIAKSENLTHYGEWWVFVLVTLLSGIIMLDIAFPLLFFKLKHFLTVQDAEPTEFFIMTQRFSWKLAPFLISIFYIAGLFILA